MSIQYRQNNNNHKCQKQQNKTKQSNIQLKNKPIKYKKISKKNKSKNIKTHQYCNIIYNIINNQTNYNNYNSIKQNNKKIISLIKQIKQLFHLQLDTYYIALQLATIIQLNKSIKFCYPLAGTILLIAHKLYENQKFTFDDIYQWSGCMLKKQMFLQIEAEILIGLNFLLPTIDPMWTVVDIQNEVNRIQAMYLS